jgi:hypothetical protein
MTTPSAITTIRTSHCIEFCPHEMLASRPTMTAFTEDPDLVYKV